MITTAHFLVQRSIDILNSSKWALLAEITDFYITASKEAGHYIVTRNVRLLSASRHKLSISNHLKKKQLVQSIWFFVRILGVSKVRFLSKIAASQFTIWPTDQQSWNQIPSLSVRTVCPNLLIFLCECLGWLEEFPFEIMAARAAILKSHSVNFMENYMSDFWGWLEEVSFRKWPRSDLQYRCHLRHLEIIFCQFQGKPFFILIFSMLCWVWKEESFCRKWPNSLLLCNQGLMALQTISADDASLLFLYERFAFSLFVMFL